MQEFFKASLGARENILRWRARDREDPRHARTEGEGVHERYKKCAREVWEKRDTGGDRYRKRYERQQTQGETGGERYRDSRQKDIETQERYRKDIDTQERNSNWKLKKKNRNIQKKKNRKTKWKLKKKRN